MRGGVDRRYPRETPVHEHDRERAEELLVQGNIAPARGRDHEEPVHAMFQKQAHEPPLDRAVPMADHHEEAQSGPADDLFEGLEELSVEGPDGKAGEDDTEDPRTRRAQARGEAVGPVVQLPGRLQDAPPRLFGNL